MSVAPSLERDRWERPFPDDGGLDELAGNVLGIGTAGAIPKGDELAASVKSSRHMMTHLSDGLGLID